MDVKYLREVLSYDEATGVFLWAVDRGGATKRGMVAGSIDSKGYRQIKVDGRLYLAHRLAWMYVYGVWPSTHLDHIDRDPKNNAIRNLRPCTHAENHQNIGLRSSNTSGVTGVSWVRRSKKWLAYINLNGVTHRLGLFESKADAVHARIEAKAQLHRFNPVQETA